MHFIPTFYVILRKPHEIFPFRTCVLESGQLLQSQCTSRKWKIFSTHRTASLCFFYPCPREKHHRASLLPAFSTSLASCLLPFSLEILLFLRQVPYSKAKPGASRRKALVALPFFTILLLYCLSLGTRPRNRMNRARSPFRPFAIMIN